MGKLASVFWMLQAAMPEAWVAKLNPKRPVYRGKMIDPKAYVVTRVLAEMRPPDEVPNVQEGRQRLRDIAAKFDLRVPVKRIEDVVLAGANGPLPARLYADSTAKNRPALVYFHGGGFVQGDLESHHHTCSKLAKWSGYTVISVDYRLAPEHPFPAAPEDCVAGFLSIIEQAETLGIDPQNTGLGGDSAGGCLAAVTAQQLVAKSGPRAAFQVLIYPVVDGHLATASVAEQPDDPVLPTNVLDFFLSSYLGGKTDKSDPRFSPIFGTRFAELPPTYLLTGGFDPLVDDGTLYKKALESSGVTVTHAHYPGQIHGFISVTKVIPQGAQALHGIADWLRARRA